MKLKDASLYFIAAGAFVAAVFYERPQPIRRLAKPGKKMLCHKCQGSGLHNVPTTQFQDFKRTGRRPASCSYCKGLGSRDKYQASGGPFLKCYFVFRDQKLVPVQLSPEQIPDMGFKLLLEHSSGKTMFYLSGLVGGHHIFREWTKLTAVKADLETERLPENRPAS